MAKTYDIGDIVFNKWTISRKIGEGSFGKVYEIQSEEFKRTYKSALKIISIPQSQSELREVMSDGMDEKSALTYFGSVVEEIVEEYDFMAQLKGGGHVVSCEDILINEHADGIGWDILIRMELLTALTDFIQTKPLAENEVIKLGIDICKALEICQQRNIIHRDVKPDNIFVTDFNEYKLGDFGIARTLEKTTGGLSKKGTMIYMAPEVYHGEAYNSNVDIYSLGIVLYRLLNNNRVPFMPPFPEQITYGSREEALAKRMKGEKIQAPSQASEKMSNIILKACAFGSRERYANPSDLRFELEELLFESRRNKTIEPTVTEEVKVEKPVHETTPQIIPEPIEPEPTDDSTVFMFGTEPIPEKKVEEKIPETKNEAVPKVEAEAEILVDEIESEEKTKSKASIALYAIVGVVIAVLIFASVRNSTREIIEWQDPVIEASIREYLDKPTGDITVEEVNERTVLVLNSEEIERIDDLRYFTSLESLHLRENDISDLSPLSKLYNLRSLGLSDNNISDISALSGLSENVYVNLTGNPITDWSPVDHIENVYGRP